MAKEYAESVKLRKLFNGTIKDESLILYGGEEGGYDDDEYDYDWISIYNKVSFYR